MRIPIRPIIALFLLLASTPLLADGLEGHDRLLCTTVEVISCTVDGDCMINLPWELNIPQFVEIDLKKKFLSSTKASGENRSSPFKSLEREEGVIFIQGMEGGRAFSIVITESTGTLSCGMATPDMTLSIFGACTPLSN